MVFNQIILVSNHKKSTPRTLRSLRFMNSAGVMKNREVSFDIRNSLFYLPK